MSTISRRIIRLETVTKASQGVAGIVRRTSEASYTPRQDDLAHRVGELHRAGYGVVYVANLGGRLQR